MIMHAWFITGKTENEPDTIIVTTLSITYKAYTMNHETYIVVLA